jgi:hypothetical protein
MVGVTAIPIRVGVTAIPITGPMPIMGGPTVTTAIGTAATVIGPTGAAFTQEAVLDTAGTITAIITTTAGAIIDIMGCTIDIIMDGTHARRLPAPPLACCRFRLLQQRALFTGIPTMDIMAPITIN